METDPCLHFVVRIFAHGWQQGMSAANRHNSLQSILKNPCYRNAKIDEVGTFKLSRNNLKKSSTCKQLLDVCKGKRIIENTFFFFLIL